MVLMCPSNGLEFIGRQIRPIQEKLWFSHGLACALMFCATKADYETYLREHATTLSAYEVWKVGPTRTLAVEKYWVRPAELPTLTLADYSTLTKDGIRLLQEIEIHLREVTRVAALYMPEELRKLEKIVTAANQIIHEIAFFQRPEATPPPHLSETEITEFRRDGFARHQRINQGLTQLIQLNSSLAYAVSQASSGTVPILERPCLVSQCSLLGVGTAYRALSAIGGYIEGVFEKYPVLKSIDSTYRSPEGFEVFPLVFRYRPDEWKKRNLSLQMQTTTEVIKPKITYFSSRNGFGEARFSVTSATQVLHAGDSVRWSLMTITHELLHAHVTGLLTTVLGEEPEIGMSDAAFTRYHEAFVQAIKNSDAGKPFIPPKAIDSLRYIIFAFAAARGSVREQLNANHRSGTESNARDELDIGVPEDVEDFKREFRNALRLFEEILVHTLDIRYFYAGDQDLFLGLLWESWTTVPAVVGDLDTYLLRSLAAVASLETGSVNQRLKQAFERLASKLTELSANAPENEFLKRAKNHLLAKKPRLIEMSYPNLYIADMAAIFLYSKEIEGAFWSGDDNIDTGSQDRLVYSMDTGDFSGSKVGNPIPFLADRLRRTPDDFGDLDEDYRSAWLLLAAASGAT